MKLTYRLGQIPAPLVLHALEPIAASNGVTLAPLESSAADLYFHQVSEELPKRAGIQLVIDTHPLTNELAATLITWAKERQELMKVSPLRHELGKLVVILLGRIMRLKEESTAPEHIVSLENLHQRLTNLYHDFDRLNIPRY